jgi:hypothetical protein
MIVLLTTRKGPASLFLMPPSAVNRKGLGSSLLMSPFIVVPPATPVKNSEQIHGVTCNVLTQLDDLTHVYMSSTNVKLIPFKSIDMKNIENTAHQQSYHIMLILLRVLRHLNAQTNSFQDITSLKLPARPRIVM